MSSLLVGIPWFIWAAIVPGYLAWLSTGRRIARRRLLPSGQLPDVDVLVPVRNEAASIEAKLRNLSALDYPERSVRFWIVDGDSTDATARFVSAYSQIDSRVELIGLHCANKIAQLNEGLRMTRASWVMVTDADAYLPPDTLLRLVAEGEADAEVAVVGTPVLPSGAHALERAHWRLTNWVRRREWARGSASMVAGPCYLFRRALIERFPSDVVADDIHVALVALASGATVGFANAEVIELRSPAGIRDLFWHKVRKADAYIRELFRFLPRTMRMNGPARLLLCFRAAHMMLAPLLAVAGALALFGAGMTVVAASLGAGVLCLAGATAAVGPRRVVAVLALGLLLTASVLTALFTYPFAKRTAAYPRLPGALALAPQRAASEGGDPE